MSDEVKMPEPGIDTANHAHIRVIGYTADQMREYADAKCSVLLRKVAELEQSADLHYKSHAAAIAKLAESEKRVAKLEARLHDIADSCRIVYGKVPSLPLTDETMDAGTDALHEFCLLVGIHNIDISDDAIGAEGGE